MFQSSDIQTPGEVLHFKNENIQWFTYKFPILISRQFGDRLVARIWQKINAFSLWWSLNNSLDLSFDCILILVGENWCKVGHPWDLKGQECVFVTLKDTKILNGHS